MNTFQNNPMGGMPPYGGFQNRGGMMGGMRGNAMGMRGGRGGMSPNGMMGIPMGGMNMGGMPGLMGNMGMSMPQMNGSMGMQGMDNFFDLYPAPASFLACLLAPCGFHSLDLLEATHLATNWLESSPFPCLVYMSSLPPLNTTRNSISSSDWNTGFQNPGFFPQQGAVGDSNWNPHGAKRTRQE